jgi:hypothetical protein
MQPTAYLREVANRATADHSGRHGPLRNRLCQMHPADAEGFGRNAHACCLLFHIPNSILATWGKVEKARPMPARLDCRANSIPHDGVFLKLDATGVFDARR